MEFVHQERPLREWFMKLTENAVGNCEKPMPNHPGDGPDMAKVMFSSITDQNTVQFVPSNV